MFKKTKERFDRIEKSLLTIASHADKARSRLDKLEAEMRHEVELLELLGDKLSSTMERLDRRIADLEVTTRSLERTQVETYAVAMERVKIALTHEAKVLADKEAQSVIHMR